MNIQIHIGLNWAVFYIPAIDWFDWLSMVLRLRQHNIGYTADGFYRSLTNSVKALKGG